MQQLTPKKDQKREKKEKDASSNITQRCSSRNRTWWRLQVLPA